MALVSDPGLIRIPPGAPMVAVLLFVMNKNQNLGAPQRSARGGLGVSGFGLGFGTT